MIRTRLLLAAIGLLQACVAAPVEPLFAQDPRLPDPAAAARSAPAPKALPFPVAPLVPDSIDLVCIQAAARCFPVHVGAIPYLADLGAQLQQLQRAVVVRDSAIAELLLAERRRSRGDPPRAPP